MGCCSSFFVLTLHLHGKQMVLQHMTMQGKSASVVKHYMNIWCIFDCDVRSLLRQLTLANVNHRWWHVTLLT